MSDPRRSSIITWAAALAMTGGLLTLAGSVLVIPIFHGSDLPWGLPTDVMHDQLRSTDPPALLLGWGLVTGGLVAYAGYAMRGLAAEEAKVPGLVAIGAGLLALGPGGGFLWGTILSVLSGSLAIAEAGRAAS